MANRTMRSITLFVVLLAMLAGCGKKNRIYNPYEDSGADVPPADYEGRRETRYFSVEQHDYPSTALVDIARPAESLKVDKEPLPSFESIYKQSEVADFPLGPGDVLEIIYQLQNVGRDEPYELNVQDTVEIKFLYTPQYDRTLTVRTDGKVEFPIVGTVEMVGRTTASIREELVERYGEYLKDPVIEIRVIQSNRAIEELKRAITTAPRGQSRLEPVRPDGFISLPLIGDVRAAGRTVPELAKAIVDMYREARVVDIDVTVVLLEVKSPIVYVLGEVGKPGPTILDGPMDVWRVIGQSGGFTTDADRQHVVVARSTAGGEERFVKDFLRWQSSLDARESVPIERGDVIYVPKAKSRYVYVLGEVEEPQRIRLEPETVMRASQALAMGGRVLSSADRCQVLVLRTSENDEPVVIEVDFLALSDPDSYNQAADYMPRDPVLQPGDVVYVSPSWIGDVNRFAEAWFRNGIWTIIPFNLNATYSLN